MVAKCVYCGKEAVEYIDSEDFEDYIIERGECSECEKAIVNIYEKRLVKVIKEPVATELTIYDIYKKYI